MSNKRAFTLVEILVVMVVIGFMATLISPRLFKKKDNGTVSTVLKELNNLLTIAKQEAILSNVNLRLTFNSFDFKKLELGEALPEFVIIEKVLSDNNKGKLIVEPFVSEYLDSKYVFPKNIKMERLFLGKDDLLTDNKGKGFCYISNDGLVQDVTLQLIEIQGSFKNKISLIVDPFMGEFKMVAGFFSPKN